MAVQEDSSDPLRSPDDVTNNQSDITSRQYDVTNSDNCAEQHLPSTDYRTVLCFKLQNWTVRKIMITLFIGQLLSLLLCGTSVTSGLLSIQNVTIPTAQSWINYGLLAVVYTPWLAFRQNPELDGLFSTLKDRGWKYFLLAAVDVEGNYLMVKAYHYTTVTSVQLLDCFTIPVVLVLSYFILRVKYKIVHVVGVIVCLLGVGGLILSDVLTNKNGGEVYHSIVGDLMVLAGAVMYAISNVAEEFVVKKFDMVEFLSMLGIFGTIIGGAQMAILEREEIYNLDFTSWETILLLVGFASCLFLYYSLAPVLIKFTSAAVLNLSILSADFYALTVGIFLFKYSFHPLYFVAFMLIIVGVIVFCSKEPPPSQRHLGRNSANGENGGGQGSPRGAKAARAAPEATPSCITCTEVEREEEVNMDNGKSDENTPLKNS